jgi:RNA polymerase sigma factor (sigma-70 family)
MVAKTIANQDKDLERLYAQARRYDLLTRNQEREIDGRKWAAIRTLQELLVEDPFSRDYLMSWADSCGRPLPAIERFQQRKHRFLLRRELADYLPGGAQADQLTELAATFTASCSAGVMLQGLLELSLPASLVVGMAEAVIHRREDQVKSKVATALIAWERHWPRGQPPDVTLPAAATVTALAEQIERYTAARDLLIMHNLRLVYTIAGRNHNRGTAFLDLVQEGTLGLLRAAEKFQFERGYRFSTYAFNWITQGVKRHLADSAGTIRYPGHVQEQLSKVHGERGRILARSGTAPGDTELAKAVKLPVDKTRELLQLRNFGVSLEAPRFDDEAGGTLLDSIPGGPFAGPGDEAEQASLNHRLLSEIQLLDEAEQKVVIRRWGLNDGPALTRAEIADQMSVSTEWVRQLEQSALAKLRKSEMMHAVYEDHCPHPKYKKEEMRTQGRQA